MATNGTFAAYNQLTPLQGSVTEDLLNQEQLGFQIRAEQRQIDAIKKNEEDKVKARKDALREKVVKNLNNYDTGSRSLNELQGKLLIKAQNEYIPIIETLENTKATEEDKLRAQLKLQNLQDLPEKLKTVTDFYTNQDLAYRQGVASGKLFRNPEYEKLFQTGFENYHLDLDENGSPVVAFVDRNKDGKIDILDVQDYEQIKNGLPTFNFQPRYDKEDLLKDSLNKIQPDDIQTINGAIISESKKLNQDKAKAHIDSLMYKNDGTPTDVLKSLAREQGVDVNDTKAVKAVYDDYLNEMNLRTPKLYKETPNTNALGWAEFNYRKGRDAKEDEKTKTTYEVVETPQIYADAKITSAKGYKTVSIDNSRPIPSIQAYVNGNQKVLTNATINSYTVKKDRLGNRKMYFEISYQDTKGKKLKNEALDGTTSTDKTIGAENKTVIAYLAQKDAVKYARQLGFKNTSEMANAAKVGKEVPEGVGSKYN